MPRVVQLALGTLPIAFASFALCVAAAPTRRDHPCNGRITTTANGVELDECTGYCQGTVAPPCDTDFGPTPGGWEEWCACNGVKAPTVYCLVKLIHLANGDLVPACENVDCINQGGGMVCYGPTLGPYLHTDPCDCAPPPGDG